MLHLQGGIQVPGKAAGQRMAAHALAVGSTAWLYV